MYLGVVVSNGLTNRERSDVCI